MTDMTPREIVQELDKFIIGQNDAKRAVAIAMRNRWRRLQVDPELKDEITPKNILMIGPTGVGKTEIARRLANLANAPFVKVEATKFTEVGYVGRDVESMVRDLVEISVKRTREQAMQKVQYRAQEAAEERILDVLLPPARGGFANEPPDKAVAMQEETSTRMAFRKKLRENELDDKEIEIEVSANPVGIEIMAPPGMEEMTSQLQGLFQNMSSDRKKPRKIKVKDALNLLQDEEAGKLVNDEEIKTQAMRDVEQRGIIFIDEIDKVTTRHDQGASVSREGVQRDLLPMVEGCTVSTKFGSIKTDHILFIASGAFQMAKPSDLIPELQGRLPIRVELAPLSTNDFVRILTEPDASLTKQYAALMNTEGVEIEFDQEAVVKIAEVAWQVNERMENIGARRLYTVMERLMENISYEASDSNGQNVKIDAAYVDEHLRDLVDDEDLTRYIL